MGIEIENGGLLIHMNTKLNKLAGGASKSIINVVYTLSSTVIVTYPNSKVQTAYDFKKIIMYD